MLKKLMKKSGVLIIFSLISFNVLALEILTVCDSITQGLQRRSDHSIFGIISPVNGAANVGGYQPVLKQLLDANLETSNVYNWGIGGERSSQTVNRINSILNSRPADYLLILCGANDVLLGISSNTTKASIEFMVNQSLAKGVTPIVAELTPITEGSYDFSVWSSYNPKIRAIAAAKGIPLAYMFGKGNDANASSWVSDMRLRWRGGAATPYHSGDQLHLSNLGYQVMAGIWFDVLSDATQSSSDISPIINSLLLWD